MKTKDGKVKIIASTGSVKNRKSKEPNRDRVVSSLFLSRKGMIGTKCTPDDIIELYSIMEDVRLTSFILGVTVETAKDAISGELFPEGLLYSYGYIAEKLGVTEAVVASSMKRLYGLSKMGLAEANSEHAKEILMDVKHYILDDVISSSAAGEILGVNRAVFVRLAQKLGVKETRAGGGHNFYKENIVYAISKRLKKLPPCDVVRVAKDTFPREILTKYLTSRVSFYAGDRGFELGPIESSVIIQKAYVDGMTWVDYQTSVINALNKRNSEILEELINIVKQGN